MFRRVTAFAIQHARVTLVGAVLVAGLAGLLSTGLANRLSPVGLEDPSSGSTQANTLVGRATGYEPLPGVIALMSLGHPVTGGTNTKAGLLQGLSAGLEIHQVVEAIEADHAVGQVRSALDGGSQFVSRKGKLTYLTVQFRAGSERAHVEAARHLARKLRHMSNVKLGGPDLATAQAITIAEEDTRRAELLSFPILILLSVWFFRGLVAAMLPIVLGASAILVTRASLNVATHVLSISALVLSLVTALGIGLAIDYSLLIVSRFREELALDPRVPEALRRTMATAGRTVLFSASTVMVASASLLVLPQRFFYSMGLGCVLVALLICLSALTVLPALLAMLGPRVNALAPSRLQRSADAASRPMLTGRWYRFALLVMRRPLPIAVCAAAALLALGAPVLSLKLASPDVSVLPNSTSARQVSNALRSDFKVNPERTLMVVAAGATDHQLAHYRRTLAHLPGVTSATSFEHLKRHTAVTYLTTSTEAASSRSQQLVRRVRSMRVSFQTRVGGPAAAFLDLKGSIASHLPWLLLVVAFTTCLSIFLLTGSVVLPPKTLLMNALTVTAALGIVVLIFQHGDLQGLFQYQAPGAIEIVAPVLLIAIIFGLSTDYGVFLIDRIRETREAGYDNEQAIALGLERTGRITTTAALLLCVAIGSLVTSRVVNARELALGVAVAVLIDATVVRTLLVPALMRLLGELNWWAPAPLRRLHARLHGTIEPGTEHIRPRAVGASRGPEPKSGTEPPSSTEPPMSGEPELEAQ